MTDPRIAVLAALSSPDWHPVPEAHGMPWGEAEELLAAYDASRAAVPSAPADRAALPETARLHDEILSLQAELAKMRDLLRSENQRANSAIDRETTAEEAAEEHRLALSEALGLGTGAPWGAIRERAAVLPAVADRTTVMLWAADELDRYVGHQSSDAAPEVEGARLVLRELRRIAGQPSPVEAGKCGYYSPSGAYRCTQPAGHLGYHRHVRPDSDEWSSWVTGTAEPEPPAVGAQQPKEADPPRSVCVCGHTRAEHLTVSGRLLCDACDPDSTDNLVCKEFEAL